MASRVFKATAAMMGVLNRVLPFSLRVEGLDNLSDRPTLFVVNHFTRMETFIVPYALHKHTHKELRALADDKLFQGIFGSYLRGLGARSTRAPSRNRMIIGDLVTGRHDWVIFPEGVLVKNKKVVRGRKLRFSHAGEIERPHTGAAVLALKAELVRGRYLRAWRADETDVMSALEEKYGIVREEGLNQPGLVITPVNITFYPLRPRDNVISRLASGLKPSLSERAVEELRTEGSLLLKKTDMTLYFSPPIEVGDYLTKPLAAARRVPFLSEARGENLVLAMQCWPLTRRFMKVIYRATAVNIDHLFCQGLQALKAPAIAVEDFHRALYLSALIIRQREGRRTHDSLGDDLIKLITDEPHGPLEDIYEFARSKGVVERVGGVYQVARRAAPVLDDPERGTIRVIANEVEPIPFVMETISRYVNMPRAKARAELSDRMVALDAAHFEEDYAEYHDPAVSKAPSIGRPFLLESGSNAVGVLLCHGYLAAPAEMRPMGEFFRAAGYTVYGARLRGFGTAPEQLLDVTWKDWMVSFNRAYAVLRARCDRVVIGGFSAGALLALLNAARKGNAVESVFCIDTPLILMNRKVDTLAPAAAGWNRFMRWMRITATVAETILNESETPDINYPRHYLDSVTELRKLIAACRDHLGEVCAPCLIIHGSDDPVADPGGSDEVFNTIGSEIKKQVTVEADYHNLVQQEGRERVFAEVLRFISDPSAAARPMKEVA